jgi:hypothetical protein
LAPEAADCAGAAVIKDLHFINMVLILALMGYRHTANSETRNKTSTSCSIRSHRKYSNTRGLYTHHMVDQVPRTTRTKESGVVNRPSIFGLVLLTRILRLVLNLETMQSGGSNRVELHPNSYEIRRSLAIGVRKVLEGTIM